MKIINAMAPLASLLLYALGCSSGPQLVGRAVLPFVDAQPVQGFSAIIADQREEGIYFALSDNDFGATENSTDDHLRVYRIRPEMKTADGGAGSIEVVGFFELRDPQEHLPFTLVSELADNGRVLTGADLDVEAFQQAPDGTFWFGDELGPFLIHTDSEGRVLGPPLSLPDPEGQGSLLSPQHPWLESNAAIHLANALDAHGRRHGAQHRPIISPHYHLVGTDSAAVFDLARFRYAGFLLLPWTVNDRVTMEQLIVAGAEGIITDRPDLLRQLDLPPGFDAQGHRGARGLRPENTIPAMEAALDELVTTLETDLGLTADLVPILSHEPRVAALSCRSVENAPEGVLIKSHTAAVIQAEYVCDKVLPSHREQSAELSLSPVSVAFAEQRSLPHPYVMPTLADLFAFVPFYEDYYRSGPGQAHDEATARAENAATVGYNIEIKRNPQAHDETFDAEAFAISVGQVVSLSGAEERTVVQSFELASLLAFQARFPSIRPSFLVQESSLVPQSPWLAGLHWPETPEEECPRVPTSGGFEGMAVTSDGLRLLAMLEKPLVGSEARDLWIFEVDIATEQPTGVTYRYLLDERATSISDFVMIDDTRGLVIERDDSEGDLDGFRAIYAVTLQLPGQRVIKRQLVDLMRLPDPHGISRPSSPFFAIEGLLVLDERRILVLNDSFPPSVDTEIIVIDVGERLF